MFIQIKDIAISIKHIESVRFYKNHITVYTDAYDGGTYDFINDEAEAFRRWWEEKAGVYVAL
jgi:hypothetical protein